MLLLKNCYYLHTSAHAEGVRGADVLIEGNKIARIAPEIVPDNDGCRVIDASRHVVIPGFVNTHHHFYQTLTRNLPKAQNAKLFEWLLYLYEIWKHLDEEAVHLSSLLAMGELLKTGCTTTTDHHYLYPNSFTGDMLGIQFEAADTLGIRFSPTRGSMSLSKKDGGLPPDSVVQREEEILRDSERAISRYHDPSDWAMHKVVLAPCSPFSVTPQLMKSTAQLARANGVRLHTHLAETEDENDFCEAQYKKRPLELMEECEFIGPDVFYAHGIFFDDNELERLKESGTHISHCPSSNMRLASGICRVRDMVSLGINVALGVDGSASNDSSDMLGELRNCMLLQRVKYGADALTAREVFQIASENGANLLNFPVIGRIEEGWAADIALFDITRMEYAGSQSDPLASLIFTGYNHGTDYTIVNGRVVVEEGRLCGIDERELWERANSVSFRMLEAYDDR